MGFDEILAKRRGVVFILSAPSGAGKTTLITRLLKIFPEMALSVSYTTRARRSGEAPGEDYFFVTEERFARMRARGEFAEWARVHGYFYGTPRRPLEASIRGGRDMLLDIDVQGAKKIKRQYPHAVSVFLLPPSWQELEKRLALRGTDQVENIRQRLTNARREIQEMIRYDYLIVNREIGEAVESLRSNVLGERLKVCRRTTLEGRGVKRAWS
jgi:guanylate kinase